MVELILTSEEKANSFLEWDDASLGKAVKKIALIINDNEGKDSIKIQAGIAMLIARAVKAGSDHTTLHIDQLTCGEESLGSWEISITRLV